MMGDGVTTTRNRRSLGSAVPCRRFSPWTRRRARWAPAWSRPRQAAALRPRGRNRHARAPRAAV